MPRDAVIVQVPLAYVVEGRRPAGRRVEAVTVLDSVPVTVRSLSRREAPVAVSATLDGEGRVEWRSVGGVLMEPVGGADSLERIAARRWGNVPGGAPHNNPFIHPASPLAREPKAGGADPWRRVPDRADCRVRPTVSDGRDAAAVQAQAQADGLAVIDGRLHVPSPGPALWYLCDWRRPKEAPRLVVSRLTRDVDPSLVVGATDAEWLLSEGAGLLPMPPRARDVDIEVPRPEAVTWDSDAHSLVETARLTLGDAMPNRAVANLSLPFLEAWMRYGDGEFDTAMAGEEMAGLLRACVSERRKPGSGRQGDYKHEGHLSRAAAAVARWDMRRPEPTPLPSTGR